MSDGISKIMDETKRLNVWIRGNLDVMCKNMGRFFISLTSSSVSGVVCGVNTSRNCTMSGVERGREILQDVSKESQTTAKLATSSKGENKHHTFNITNRVQSARSFTLTVFVVAVEMSEDPQLAIGPLGFGRIVKRADRLFDCNLLFSIGKKACVM